MKITVITVCFNSVKTIERTIKSVLAQNYSELEYIIIDGGSTDGTLDIIRKYKENLSVWISEPDDGLYDAMNKGLAKATGEVFAFLNSDDYYTENVLERVNEYFKTDDVDMVSGNMYICAEGTVKKAVYDKSNRENLLFGVVYPQPALFAKRELYIKYGGFDTSYKIAADSDWVMKVCLNGAKVICVEDYFTYFSDGGISSRKQYLALEEEYRMALKYAKLSAYAHMEKRVREFYPAQLKMVERRERKRNAIEKRTDDIKKLFDYSKAYYIWGIGNRGMECMELFEYLGLRIVGFIDSYKEKAQIRGYQVIKPENADLQDPGIRICITPKGYEEEIIRRLKDTGVETGRSFTYAELLDQMISLGSIES